MTERGSFVVIVGPDGVGKTTFARRLMAEVGPTSRYFHFRPPVRGPLATSIPDAPPLPKATSRPNVVMGWARLAVAFVRFWLGYLATVRPALRAGSIVIADRWAYGYLVQPRPLRFAGPPQLARIVLRLLPQPDLVLNLTAPPDVILGRKRELSEPELRSELEAWRGLPVSMVTLDARRSPESLADDVRRLVGS